MVDDSVIVDLEGLDYCMQNVVNFANSDVAQTALLFRKFLPSQITPQIGVGDVRFS